MENLTHALFGAVLSKAGLEKQTRLATPALLIAANLPDIDVVGGYFGKNYLDFHRGITHAAISLVFLALGLSAVFWAASRFRKFSGSGPVRLVPMTFVTFVGVLSHPLLDSLNDYGVRPWLPFSGRKYYGDLLSVVDPWLWIIFGLFLMTGSRGVRLFGAVLGVLLATIITAGAGFRAAALWLAVLAAAAFAARSLQARGFQPARLALVLFSAYLAWSALARLQVVRNADAGAPGLIPDRVLKIDVLPARPVSVMRWRVVIETPEKFYLARVGFQNWRRRPPLFESYEKNLKDPCYHDALQQPQMAAMARFARFPSVDVRSGGNRCTVFLRDLRYARRSIPGWGVAHGTLVHSLSRAPHQSE